MSAFNKPRPGALAAKPALPLGPAEALISVCKRQAMIPQRALLNTFLTSLKHAGHQIGPVFFDNPVQPLVLNNVDWSAQRDTFAQAYLAWHLSLIADRAFNTTVHTAQALSVWSAFIATHGATLGRDLYIQTLINDRTWAQMAPDFPNIVSHLLRLMEDPRFFKDHVFSQRSVRHFVRMLLTLVDALDNANNTSFFTQVRSKLAKNLTPKQMPRGDSWNIDFFNSSTANAVSILKGVHHNGLFHDEIIQKVSEVQVSNTEHVNPAASPGQIPKLSLFVKTIFGANVVAWLMEGGAGNFATGCRPDNVVLDRQLLSLSGCFSKDTQVYVLDGEKLISAPIQHLDENDVVVGANGSLAILSDEVVVSTSETETMLYGFNDENPFFTAAHMFWTPTGWKAVHPEAALAENEHISVSKLREGDVVLRAVLPDDVNSSRAKLSSKVDGWDYESITIDKITSERLPMHSPVFDIHVREGVRSYHANGYLVAVNSPELTAERVARNIGCRLTVPERQKVLEELKKHSEIWGKILGANALPAIDQALKRRKNKPDSDDCTKKTVRPKKKGRCPENMLRNRYIGAINLSPLTSDSEGDNGACAKRPLPKISLVEGSVLLDDTEVDDSYLFEDRIFWKRTLEDGMEETGVVSMEDNLLVGKGVVSRSIPSAGPEAAAIVETTQVNAVSNAIYYTFAVDGDEDTYWEYFVEMGTKIVNGFVGGLTIRLLLVNSLELDAEDPLRNAVELGVATNVYVNAPDYQLTFDMSGLPFDTFFFPFSKIEGAKVSIDGASLAGTIYQKEVNPETDKYEDVPKAFTGVAMVHDDALARVREIAESYDLYTPAEELTAEDETVSRVLNLTAERKKKVKVPKAVASAMPAAHKQCLERRKQVKLANRSLLTAEEAPSPVLASVMETETLLSVQDLYALRPPDQEDVDDLTQALFIQYCKYSMSDEELALIQATRPSLSTAEKNFLGGTEIQTFFKDHFIPGYLSSGLIEAESLQNEWGDDVDQKKEKMLFFWSGDGEKTLANAPGYNDVQTFISTRAFEKMMPELEPYLAEGATTWGLELYNYIMGPDTDAYIRRSTIQNTSLLSGGTDLLKMYATILLSLAPEQTYAADLYSFIRTGAILQAAQDLQGEDMTYEWLDDMIKQVIVQILAYDTSDETYGELVAYINEEVEKQLERKAESAEEAASTFKLTFEAQMHVGIELLMESLSKGLSLRAANQNNVRSIQLNQVFQGANMKVFGAIFYLLGAAAFGYYVIDAILEWEKLTGEQRALASVNLMAVGWMGVVGVMKLVEGLQSRSAAKALQSTANLNRVSTGVDVGVALERVASENSPRRTSNADVPENQRFNADTGRRGSQNAAGANKTALELKWEKRFKVTARVTEGLNFLMLATAAVVLAFQVAADLREGQPTSVIVLGIVSVVVMACAAFLSLYTAIAGKVTMRIPVIGMILVVTSIILQIVGASLREEPVPPDTPQETWVKEVGRTFVEGLEEPSAKFALQSVDLAPRPSFNDQEEEDRWLGELVVRTAEFSEGTLESGTFVVEGDPHLESSEKTVKLEVVGTEGDDVTMPSVVIVYFACSKRLERALVQDSAMETFHEEGDDIGWFLDKTATEQQSWFLYRREFDATQKLTVELVAAEDFNVYAAVADVSPLPEVTL